MVAHDSGHHKLNDFSREYCFVSVNQVIAEYVQAVEAAGMHQGPASTTIVYLIFQE